MPESREWFVVFRGQERGPYSLHDLQRYAYSGLLTPDSTVRHISRATIKAGDIRDLVFASPMQRPTAPVASSTSPIPAADDQQLLTKEKITIRVLKEYPSTTADSGVPSAPVMHKDGSAVSAGQLVSQHARDPLSRPLVAVTVLIWVLYAVNSLLSFAYIGDPRLLLEGLSIFELASIILFIAYVIAFTVLAYRCWIIVASLPAQIGVLPQKAIGFLFIPCFNFYWIFYSGLAYIRASNHCLEQSNQKDVRANGGLLIASGILFILSSCFSLLTTSVDPRETPDAWSGLQLLNWLLDTALTIVWFLNIRNFTQAALAIYNLQRSGMLSCG